MHTAGKNIRHEPPSPSHLPTREPEVVEGSQGTKRKTNQLETGLKPASVPKKRAKTIEEASHAARSTLASVAPRPQPAASNQKPAAPSKKPVLAAPTSKKRSSLPDDAPDEPRTPAPPLKKPRVQQNTSLADNATPEDPKAPPLKKPQVQKNTTSSVADDATPEDPRNPAPPHEKPQVQKKKDTAQGKAQALRRTGKSHLI